MTFSHRTQKDDFLYIMAKHGIKCFCEPFPSNLDPESWRPFFFFVLGEGLPKDVHFSFTHHPKSTGSLPGSAQHMADYAAFTTYWVNTRLMALHFYSEPRVLRAAGLIPGSTADPGTLEALRATFNVRDAAPPLPPAAPRFHPAAPATSLDQRPLS
ncbi:hypothetical protein LIER_30862 [Lithospermum erythrorhizon]|uniref:Uncharacterized protein n=1 Tax=Lithospermum erythrorhizon TaxID=34254 RepID=A0AAV3RSS2_LITER